MMAGPLIVSYEEIKSQVSHDERVELEAFCEKISSALKHAAKNNGLANLSTTVSTQGVKGYIIEQAINECNNRGWTARRVSDQRDGDYIEIKNHNKGGVFDR